MERGIVNGDEDLTRLKFQLAALNDLGQLARDILTIKEIFLLSIGCIRLHSGKYCNLLENETATEGESLGGEEYIQIARHQRPSRRDRSPSLSDGPGRVRAPGHSSRESYPTGLDAYELVLAKQTHGDFVDLARPFDAHREHFKVLSRVKNSDPLSEDNEEYRGMSNVPPETPWIRLSKERLADDIFIARADAQEMAHALLQMSWHPESYLLGSSRHVIGM